MIGGGINATIRAARADCGYVFCRLVVCANVGQAATVTYQLTLQQAFPDIETAAGTFSIDSAFLTPNMQINFVNFLSFSMPVEGILWTLSDALLPATEGVITDASGAVLRFNDSAATFLTEFCRGGCGQSLAFLDGGFFYFTGGGESGGDTSGFYSISVISGVAEVPLPTALPLFATGLGVLGLLGWRRKRKAAAVT